MRRHGYLLQLGLLVALCATAEAKELLYQPQNPSFGGPVSNGPNLMNDAQAQNHFTAHSPTLPGAQDMSQQQMFASQLQSMLLSSLASQVNNAIFGPNAAASGTFVYGSQTISFNRTLSAVNLTIQDSSTGQTTKVQVPLVQVTQ